MTLDSMRCLGAWTSLVCALALGGCVDRGTTGDGDDGSAGGSRGDDDGESGSADGGGSAGNDTADSPSDPGDDLPRACADACEIYTECFPEDGTLEDCLEECSLGLDSASGECQAALVELIDCYAGLECDEWFSEGACREYEDALDDRCDGGDDQVCSVGIGGGEDGWCGASYVCPNQPSLAIECDDAECSCFEDDEQVGRCPSQGVCTDERLDILEHAEVCCGWSVF